MSLPSCSIPVFRATSGKFKNNLYLEHTGSTIIIELLQGIDKMDITGSTTSVARKTLIFNAHSTTSILSGQ